MVAEGAGPRPLGMYLRCRYFDELRWKIASFQAEKMLAAACAAIINPPRYAILCFAGKSLYVILLRQQCHTRGKEACRYGKSQNQAVCHAPILSDTPQLGQAFSTLAPGKRHSPRLDFIPPPPAVSRSRWYGRKTRHNLPHGDSAAASSPYQPRPVCRWKRHRRG